MSLEHFHVGNIYLVQLASVLLAIVHCQKSNRGYLEAIGAAAS